MRKLIAALTVAGAAVSLGVVTGAAPASAAVSCSYSQNTNTSFTTSEGTFGGAEYAGHYSGMTVVPSTTVVTTSGEEGQCLLKLAGFNPGTIDGVFGPNSQNAMFDFISTVDVLYNAGLASGPGENTPGPASWKWLRFYAQFRGKP